MIMRSGRLAPREGRVQENFFIPRSTPSEDIERGA
jgi:hypothetical protein